MSVIVAIKYKDGVAIASDKQTTRMGVKNENSTKIYKAKYSNTAIGVTGHNRDSNLLSTIDDFIEYRDILEKTDINKKYIIITVVEKIFNILRDHKRISLKNGIDTINSEILFASSKNLFSIGVDGSVLEFDSYITLGCGEDSVYGYLHTVENLDKMNKEEIIKILEKSIKISCKNDIYINDKIDFIFLDK